MRVRARKLRQSSARLRLFNSSYAPAFLIAAVRFHGLTLKLVCGVIAGIGFVDGVVLPRIASSNQATTWLTVSSVEDVGAEVGAYVAGYLLPVVTAPSPDWRDLVGYAIFLVITAIVYVRSDLIRINPLLFALGWRILKITTERPEPDYLICRTRPLAGQMVPTVRLAGVLIATGDPVDPDVS